VLWLNVIGWVQKKSALGCNPNALLIFAYYVSLSRSTSLWRCYAIISDEAAGWTSCLACDADVVRFFTLTTGADVELNVVAVGDPLCISRIYVRNVYKEVVA
jgi:hypothetical protein